MYEKLFDSLKRPLLYERTGEKFWTDLYIATQMLEAHLNPNNDAASRKPDFICRCVAWISSLLPEGASLGQSSFTDTRITTRASVSAAPPHSALQTLTVRISTL